MVLYGVFRKSKELKKEKQLTEIVINMVALSTPEVHPVDVQPNGHHENVVDEEVGA